MENTTAHPAENKLTDHQLQESSRRRTWIMVPVMLTMVFIGLAPLLIFAWLSLDKVPPGLASVLLFGVIPLVFIPVLIADHFAKRHALFCPDCKANLTGRFRELKLTRLCPFCGNHIATGRPRSRQAFRRYLKWSSKRHDEVGGKYSIWSFSALSLAFLLTVTLNSSNDDRESQLVVIFSIFAFIVSAYAWLRKRNYDFFLPAVTSLILLILSTLRCWYP